jgi:MFS family permease
VVFLVEFTVLIPIIFVATYAIYVVVEMTMFYLLVAFLNLESIPGRFLSGTMADRAGRFNTMVLTTTVCAILTPALWLSASDNLAAIIGYALLFDF